MSDYRIIEKIYESPKTIVYKGFKENSNEPVILKVLNKHYPTNEEVLKFNREYDLINSLTEEGIIKLYGKTKINDIPAIIMEDFGGKSFTEILKSQKKIGLEEFLRIAVRITEIIGNIHKHNIIHKDINPSNILWNIEKDIIKIIDFGISTELPREIKTSENINVLEGTLPFISPEQTGRINRFLDYRTDFYSLGVTFYLILTGQLPFKTKDMLELVYSHIAILPPSPHEVDSGIPEAVSDIVMKLMGKNEEDRYLSAYGLKADLERCLNEYKNTGDIKQFKLATSDVSDKFQVPRKLYGREQEIGALMAAFERTREGGTELLLVSGFSGIGKSMLINEIQMPIVKHKGYFISGRFEKFKKNVPYDAIIQAFSGLAKQIISKGDEVVDVWRESLSAALGPNGKIITNIIPQFELIIGKQSEVPALGPVQLQNRFNLVFQDFIRVLANSEHPLVLFLDDLQWADSASLHLLKLFTVDSDIKHLLVIGAYRHNEITESDLLMLTVDDIKKSGGRVNDIFVQPFNVTHVSQLLCDMLNKSEDETTSLAELLIKKTGGNPFYINEFLKSLYKLGRIIFSFERGWRWDMAGIEKMQSTANVVDLMAKKITELSDNAQEVLKLGACLGNSFNLDSLLQIGNKSIHDIRSALNEIFQEGMLDVIDDTYRFSHDRVQEAAYSLNSDEEKTQKHYRIGYRALETTFNENVEENIFFIVNQLNAGIEFVTNKERKRGLAELNLLAGKKALSASAYNSASGYFDTAIELLDEKTWKSDYDLTLNLYQDATFAAQLSADYQKMHKLSEIVLMRAKTILDKIKVYHSLMIAGNAQNQRLDSLKIALSVLRKLGFNLTIKPNMFKVFSELLQILLLLRGKPIENLVNLPEHKNLYHMAICQILQEIGTSSYMYSPNLLIFSILHCLKISLKYGNCVYSPIAYAGFGLIQAGIFGNVNKAHKFVMLSMEVIQKLNIKESKAKVLVLFWGMINHWKFPLRDSLKPLLDAYQCALETGDLEFASLSINAYTEILINSGIELSIAEKESAKYEKTISRLNQKTILTYHQIGHQAVLCLIGRSECPRRLPETSSDSGAMIEKDQNSQDNIITFLKGYYPLYVSFLFENYKDAEHYNEMCESIIDTMISHPLIPIFYFYNALSRLALFSTEKKNKKNTLQKIKKIAGKLQKWAVHSPSNYQHKYFLVQAEMYRVSGNTGKAFSKYLKAIALARENKYLHEEALALELTAKFWLGQDVEDIAGLYMGKAYNAYRTWGATAVADHLEKNYGHLFKLQATGKNPSSGAVLSDNIIKSNNGSTSASELIDLTTVIKASQTLSSEIDLGKLLNAIMKYSVENAGAERGFLIIRSEKDNRLYIEAESEQGKDISVLQSIPVENHRGLSAAIVYYVNRTGENIVLHDAAREGDFFKEDPYIIENKIKSILCIPIVHKRKTLGVLYFENNLSENIFTSSQLEILKILSSQAAISIENARLLIHRENAAKLEREIEIAANIQRGLLPHNPDIKDYEIATYMMPADVVGGDYYDFIHSGGRDWLVIGDVSGHGVPAGLVMMMVQTSIHTVLTQNPDVSPSKLLIILNKVIWENLSRLNEDKFITITVFAVHEKGKFIFSGLHHDIVLYRAQKNEVELIKTSGLLIGLADDIDNKISDSFFELMPGDAMLLFTDGISEAWKKDSQKGKRNMEFDMFGEKRLADIFLKNGLKPLEEIKTILTRELQEYVTHDDATFVLVRRQL